jgi:hypothetical protein
MDSVAVVVPFLTILYLAHAVALIKNPVPRL